MPMAVIQTGIGQEWSDYYMKNQTQTVNIDELLMNYLPTHTVRIYSRESDGQDLC